VLVLGLAGCASLPRPGSRVAGAAWAMHQQQVSDLRAWNLRGRISVRNEDQAWYGTIDWRQQGDAYDLKLIAPLGQGTISVRGSPNGVVVRLPNGEMRSATDPEDLLSRTVGLRLPLAGLSYWVKGLPEPNRPMRAEWDVRGRLSELRQAGWDVSYRDYVPAGAYDLPAKVFLDGGPVSVRLVVEHWETS
jgi:outer membrane lipoprotein LolB